MFNRAFLLATTVSVLLSPFSATDAVGDRARPLERYLEGVKRASSPVAEKSGSGKKIIGKGKKQFKKFQRRFAEGKLGSTLHSSSGEFEIGRRDYDFDGLRTNLADSTQRADRKRVGQQAQSDDGDTDPEFSGSDEDDEDREYDNDDEYDEGEVMQQADVFPVEQSNPTKEDVHGVSGVSMEAADIEPASHVLEFEDEIIKPLASSATAEKSSYGSLWEKSAGIFNSFLSSRLDYDSDTDYNEQEDENDDEEDEDDFSYYEYLASALPTW